MKILIKLTMIGVIFSFLNYCYADNLSIKAWKIWRKAGLPHRSAGHFFAAWDAAPWREDYAADYLINMYLLKENDRILEGTMKTKWLECLIVRTCKIDAPHALELRGLSKMVMKKHFEQVEKEEKLSPTVDSPNLIKPQSEQKGKPQQRHRS